MDEAALIDLFAPFAAVTCKRMFSGYGIYVGNACFALSAQGALWIKVEPAMEEALRAAGSEPFSMTRKDGKEVTALSFWRLPDAALDDEAALRRWCTPALAVAQRTAAAKAEQLRRMRATAAT